MVNPSFKAVSRKFWSRHSNSASEVASSVHSSAAASYRESAALKECTIRSLSARFRRNSVGWISDHSPASAVSAALACRSAWIGSTPSRRRRAMAEMHSTRVVHQTTRSSSVFARFLTTSDAGSFRQKGMIAEESQNFTFLSPVLKGVPAKPGLPNLRP